MSAPGSMRARAWAIRSASGESTPRSTQPLCVTLGRRWARMGEVRGGQRGRAADWLKKARDLGARRREWGGLFGL